MLEAAVNEEEITSSFLRILYSATDVDLRALGLRPGGVVPIEAEMCSGSVTWMLYWAPCTKMSL